MKSLRVLLLVLLALLLTVRGASGAAMSCPSVGVNGGAVAAAEAGPMNVHAADGMHVEHATVNHHAADGDSSVGAASASGGHPHECQACASGCCVTPLAFALPSVEPAPPTASVAFPALSARIPAFPSGGQDRPPRTV